VLLGPSRREPLTSSEGLDGNQGSLACTRPAAARTAAAPACRSRLLATAQDATFARETREQGAASAWPAPANEASTRQPAGQGKICRIAHYLGARHAGTRHHFIDVGARALCSSRCALDRADTTSA